MPVNLSIELRLAYLRAAMAAQEEEEAAIQTYRAFFDGEQGVLLTDRQKEYLTETVESFGNVCKRTVAIPKDRLELKPDGIAAADSTSQAYADAVTGWWTAANDDTGEADMNTLQKDVYTASLRDSNVAVIVGWDDHLNRPTFTPNLIYDGETGLIRFHYDNNNRLLFASKRWTVWNPLVLGETGKRRMTVYRPGLIERFEADDKAPGGWRFLSPAELKDADNPLGLPNPQPWTDTGNFAGQPLGIPVIPFENPGGSELTDVVNIQELINHGLGTFDIATDFHAFPLLWFAAANFPLDSATGQTIIPDFGPGKAVNLDADGSAGRIEPADLIKMFQAGVLSWVQMLALIKGWPFFLFDRSQQPPSGIALQIMEGSLVNQVKDKQVAFGGSWRRAFNMARKLHRLKTRQELPGELVLNWQPAETANDMARFEALEKKFTAGNIPTKMRWMELGYTADDIAEMEAMKEAAAPAIPPPIMPLNGNNLNGNPSNQPKELINDTDN
jgi:hypothetical protein